MGLFDNLKMVKDIVKSGIDAFKANEKLDELVKRSLSEFGAKITPAEKELYNSYKKLKDKYENTEDIDAANAMMEEVEQSELAYLLSLAENKAIPEEFRNAVRDAAAEYARANGAAIDIVGKRMMKAAKTDEEKKYVEDMIAELRKEG